MMLFICGFVNYLYYIASLFVLLFWGVLAVTELRNKENIKTKKVQGKNEKKNLQLEQ